MTSTTEARPQVPGISSEKRADDSRLASPRARGVYNPRVEISNCQTNLACILDSEKLNVLTLNARTLRTEERLVELENALKDIKWDIIGLSEVRREGENILERESNIFYHIGESSSRYGVGFLVNKKWQYNIKEFIGYSDRIAVLKFRINDTKTITIIQVYAPTSSHPDEETEEFYDLLNKACDEHRSTWTTVLGDFNAKVGQTLSTDNRNILGPHGLGTRNERGGCLLQFAFGQNLSVSNSFFFKKTHRRWTWFSPDGVTKNEIDYNLSSDKRIIKNVEALNSFKFATDHRPLRISFKFNLKIQRIHRIKSSIKRLDKNTLIMNKDQFEIELKNSFSLLPTESDDVQTQYNNISHSIKIASQKIKTVKRKTQKLTTPTKILIEERQALTMFTPAYRVKDKLVKRQIRKDLRNYNMEIVKTAIEKNQCLRTAIRGTDTGRSFIGNLRDSNGVKQGDRQIIHQICTDYYRCLYSNTHLDPQPPTEPYSCPKSIAPITGYEVHRALLSMKYSRSPGEDGITTEALKIGESVLLPKITNLFNSILHTGHLPQNFCHSNIILLHKKGDKSDLSNYRPISLISHLYKTFIKVIEKRITQELDRHQPPEQAGFRHGLSTTDHLHTLNQIIEKYEEYNLPIYLAFIDYSKAFDSLKHSTIFQALHDQDIDNTYIKLLQNIYNNSTAAIKLNTSGQSFPIQKGVKQGDPLSPKLFTATLEQVFRKLAQQWDKVGIIIGEKRLTNLRFADDIVLFSSSALELGLMITQLNEASLEVGLMMNMSKTKIMTNSVTRRLEVNGEVIEYVHEYIYLGQLVSFQARQEKEVARRTQNAWKSYWSMKDLMKGKLPLTLKRKLMDICILPVLTYGAQTWSLTEHQKSALGVCQRAMERSILGVRLSDRMRNSILRSKTQIADVGKQAASLKWSWAGHICRMSNNLWAKLSTEWTPQNVRRRRGRPRRRWRDELDLFSKNWPEKALDREEWKEGREAFAQQWDDHG